MTTYQNIIDNINNPEEHLAKILQSIKEIENITERRLLVYVADIKRHESIISPEDKTGFSDLIHDVKETEADILINSPGGLAETTESIVGILRSKFTNIRFAIPNMAKSAATLLCFSGNELLMDHRSELGPIDPQVVYNTADGPKREAAEDVLDGFKEIKDILAQEGPNATPAYVPLLNKYTIGFLRSCQNAKELSHELAKEWLVKYMFNNEPNLRMHIRIVNYFATHSKTLSHSRAIGIDKCIELGLNVIDLRESKNSSLQKKIWNLWCLYELLFERSAISKIYQNSIGCYLTKQTQQLIIKKPNEKKSKKKNN